MFVEISSPFCCALVIVENGTSSWSGDSSIPVIGRRDKELATLCFTPARCTTSKLSSDSRKGLLASFLVVSVIFNIHHSASWSVQVVNQDPPRYGISSRTARTTVRDSLCVVSNACSVLLNEVTRTPRALLGFRAPLGIRCTGWS